MLNFGGPKWKEIGVLHGSGSGSVVMVMVVIVHFRLHEPTIAVLLNAFHWNSKETHRKKS